MRGVSARASRRYVKSGGGGVAGVRAGPRRSDRPGCGGAGRAGSPRECARHGRQCKAVVEEMAHCKPRGVCPPPRFNLPHYPQRPGCGRARPAPCLEALPGGLSTVVSRPGKGVATLSRVLTDSRPIAMLLDGGNAQPSLLEQLLAEAAKYGTVTTRRI